MLMTILLVIVAIIAIIVLLASRQPDSFRVQRAATVQAPPDRVFALINDFQNWLKWSPWEKLDPAMKKDFGGPPSGAGSTYGWSGNSKAGEGRMEIVESVPPSRVKLDLNFIRPFKSNNSTQFDLAPSGTGTSVTWTMNGSANLMTKVWMLFVNMDKMVGKDFEEGLMNLKRVAEKS